MAGGRRHRVFWRGTGLHENEENSVADLSGSTAERFEWDIADRLNIAEACTDHQNPEDPALIVDDGSAARVVSFSELGLLSRRFSSMLADSQIVLGDRVAVMVPQGVEVAAAHLGTWRFGAISVPLSVKFGPEAVAYRLQHCGAKVLVIDGDCLARVREVLPQCFELHTVVVVGGDDSQEGIGESRIMRFEAIDNFAAIHGAANTGSDTPALLVYTSGTTGNPKGALHAHRVLPAHIPGVQAIYTDAPQPGDVFWTPADWAWLGGLFDVLFPALALGRPVVATPDKFSPARALRVMRDHRVTATFLPPTALKQFRSSGMDESDTHGLALRIIATGGEALGAVLREWVERTFAIPLNEFYGQTEMNLILATQAHKNVQPGSMGRALPGLDPAVLDPAGQIANIGQVGEICVRAENPGQFLGYWDNPEATAKKVHNGWIHTGDLGKQDDGGDFWFEGRNDDLISSAGYRVGPGEIEECLLTHPAVAMAAVVGIADDLLGEAIHAFVVLNEGLSPSDQLGSELQRHVKTRLAFYQYPRAILFRTELPMTSTGKIVRRTLRDSLGRAAS
jgi:acetyl-CoA synthetase